jgi:hypothetical protein
MGTTLFVVAMAIDMGGTEGPGEAKEGTNSPANGLSIVFLRLKLELAPPVLVSRSEVGAVLAVAEAGVGVDSVAVFSSITAAAVT